MYSSRNCAYRDSNSDLSLSSQVLCRFFRSLAISNPFITLWLLPYARLLHFSIHTLYGAKGTSPAASEATAYKESHD